MSRHDPLPGSSVRRRTSPILLRYVAREYLVPLLCSLLVFELLFLTIDFFNVLEDLVDARAPFLDSLTYFLLRQPGNLVHVLPLALLLTAGYMMSNFVRNHELTAVRASGVSLGRLCLPVWAVAALFSLVSLWLSEAAVPACAARAETLMARLCGEEERVTRTQAALAYRNPRLNRHWFFEAFTLEGEQRGVLIKQFRDDQRLAWELRAESAVYQDGRWVLRNVVRAEYDQDGVLPRRESVPVPELVLDSPGEAPSEIISSLRPVEELTVRDMLRMLRRRDALPQSTRNVFWTALWHRLAYPFSCLAAALLGVGLSVSRDGGSRLRGFSLAVALLVAYHILSQFLVLLGKNGILPPVVGGAFSTAALIAWGLWQVYRKR